MSIPEYILKAARGYAAEHGGGRRTEDAFIAGFDASRSQKKRVAVTEEVEPQLFNECWKTYNRKGDRGKAMSEWCRLSADERRQVLPHVKVYVASREIRFQKDFERYLRDKVFRQVIFRGNQVVYDPSQFVDANVYRPTVDGIFQWWNEERKCLMFNGHVDMINDGYTEETRPDGARAAWNMYEWVWSREQKKWIKQ